ncbi:hypothetical protein DPX16_17768 [Anabarilius grahami]|uniref:Uncharacterized protein n=1 Tax=Anabarilius grahami TaxID=495550 RepID=A0A3N0YHC4_ANAGA|nr:hypothetical protein DPX16_17768 [Anabarilius grahami]
MSNSQKDKKNGEGSKREREREREIKCLLIHYLLPIFFPYSNAQASLFCAVLPLDSPELLIPFFCHVSLVWVHTNLTGSIIPVPSHASGKPLLGISSLFLIRVSHSRDKKLRDISEAVQDFAMGCKQNAEIVRKNFCLLAQQEVEIKPVLQEKQLGGEKSSVDEKQRKLELVTSGK